MLHRLQRGIQALQGDEDGPPLSAATAAPLLFAPMLDVLGRSHLQVGATWGTAAPQRCTTEHGGLVPLAGVANAA